MDPLPLVDNVVNTWVTPEHFSVIVTCELITAGPGLTLDLPVPRTFASGIPIPGNEKNWDPTYLRWEDTIACSHHRPG